MIEVKNLSNLADMLEELARQRGAKQAGAATVKEGRYWQGVASGLREAAARWRQATINPGK